MTFAPFLFLLATGHMGKSKPDTYIACVSTKTSKYRLKFDFCVHTIVKAPCPGLKKRRLQHKNVTRTKEIAGYKLSIGSVKNIRKQDNRCTVFSNGCVSANSDESHCIVTVNLCGRGKSRYETKWCVYAVGQEKNSKLLFGQIHLTWFAGVTCTHVTLSGDVYCKIGALYTQQPDSYKCALDMRYAYSNDFFDRYFSWRMVHSTLTKLSTKKKKLHKKNKLHKIKGNNWPKPCLQSSPCHESTEHWNPFSNAAGSAHEIMYSDVFLDADVSIVENENINILDYYYVGELHPTTKVKSKHDETVNNMSTKSFMAKRHLYLFEDKTTNVINKGLFTTLGFRKHVVLAYKNTEEIIIVNTSSPNFADTPSDLAHKSHRKLRRDRRNKYEKVWKHMALCNYALPALDDENINKIRIVHLDIQGRNDCLVWTLLIQWYVMFKSVQKIWIEKSQKKGRKRKRSTPSPTSITMNRHEFENLMQKVKKLRFCIPPVDTNDYLGYLEELQALSVSARNRLYHNFCVHGLTGLISKSKSIRSFQVSQPYRHCFVRYDPDPSTNVSIFKTIQGLGYRESTICVPRKRLKASARRCRWFLLVQDGACTASVVFLDRYYKVLLRLVQPEYEMDKGIGIYIQTTMESKSIELNRIDMCIKIQRAYLNCHKELFSLRKRIRYVIKRLVPGGGITCPITLELIKHPLFCNGKLYEREAIKKWLETTHTCPLTREPNCLMIDINNIPRTVSDLINLIQTTLNIDD